MGLCAPRVYCACPYLELVLTTTCYRAAMQGPEDEVSERVLTLGRERR
jgi:hypothetical protein